MSTPRLDDLQGKVCLITGGARTLGAAIARRLAHAGAHVAIHYHQSADAAQDLYAELSALGVRTAAIGADVTQPEDVARLVADTWASFGAVDILVNNVGPYLDTPFLELTLADFDRIWAGNVRATFLVTQAIGRRMKARGYGQIINIAATDYVHRSYSMFGEHHQEAHFAPSAALLRVSPRYQCRRAYRQDGEAAYAL